MATIRQRKDNNVFIVGLTLMIALAGAGAIYLAVLYGLPHDANAFYIGLFYLLTITVLLAVPYWMLKIGVHEAHLRNPNEKELELRDVPKFKDDLARELNDNFPPTRTGTL